VTLANLQLKVIPMMDPATHEPQSTPAPETCRTQPPEPVTEPVSEAVRSAIESGDDVQNRIRDIVVSLFRRADATTASARAAVNGIMQTAADIANRSTPDKPDSVLRNVIDGVTAGLAAVADSTKDAVQEAAERGQRFAGPDLDHAKKNLSGISDILKDTVKYFSSRMTEETGSTFQELKTYAERSAAVVMPAIKASVEAVTKHPVQSASEAAGTAVRGSQLAAGALLGAMSGLLASAADYLDPDRRRNDKTVAETPADQEDQAS